MIDAAGEITVPLEWIGFETVRAAFEARTYLPFTVGPFTGRIAVRQIGIEDEAYATAFGGALLSTLMLRIEFAILPEEAR